MTSLGDDDDGDGDDGDNDGDGDGDNDGDDEDGDHLTGSHCCVHPTSRFSARREPSFLPLLLLQL